MLISSKAKLLNISVIWKYSPQWSPHRIYFRPFSSISPPESHDEQKFSKFQNFTLSRNNVWNLPFDKIDWLEQCTIPMISKLLRKIEWLEMCTIHMTSKHIQIALISNLHFKCYFIDHPVPFIHDRWLLPKWRSKRRRRGVVETMK